MTSDPTHWLVLAHLDLRDPVPPVAAGRPEALDLSLGRLAPPARNGGWFAHLHVQRVPKHTPLAALDGYGDAAALWDGRAPAPLVPGQLLTTS